MLGVTAASEPSPRPCQDRDAQCAEWALAGDCDTSRELMEANCAEACGFCDDGAIDDALEWHCEDLQSDCAERAALGLCERNPASMLKLCALSCNRCTEAQMAAMQHHGADEDSFVNLIPSKLVQSAALALQPVDAHRDITALRANCTDMLPQCTLWANHGECERSRERMLHFCARACGACTCADFDSGCAEWALAGECESAVPRAMRACPRSCGLCNDVSRGDSALEKTAAATAAALCIDTRPDCAGWAAVGECEVNDAVPVACPQSCGACGPKAHNGSPRKAARSDAEREPKVPAQQLRPRSPSCVDASPDCERWARMGECRRDPEAMGQTCRKSCNLCTATLLPLRAPHFSSADGESAGRAAGAAEAKPCRDLLADCVGWAQLGECEHNAVAMLANCPMSCGACAYAAHALDAAADTLRLGQFSAAARLATGSEQIDQTGSRAIVRGLRRFPVEELRRTHPSLDTWVRVSIATNIVLAAVLLLLFARRFQRTAPNRTSSPDRLLPLPFTATQLRSSPKGPTLVSPRRAKSFLLVPALSPKGTPASEPSRLCEPSAGLRKDRRSPQQLGVG